MRREFVREQHSLPAHGHQGITKTLERLERDYYFPSMRNIVEKTVLECDLCIKSKLPRHLPYGLVKVFPPAGKAWKLIALDFIVKLPPSTEPITGTIYDAILVVTCRLTKYRHFVLYKESSNARELVYTFLKVIVSQHGLLEEIILNRDKLFTFKFWKLLMAQLGTNHKLSIAFYP